MFDIKVPIFFLGISAFNKYSTVFLFPTNVILACTFLANSCSNLYLLFSLAKYLF